MMMMMMMKIVYCQVHPLPFGTALRPSNGSYQILDIQNPKPVLKRTEINNTHIQSICKGQSALKRSRRLRVDGLERAISEGHASTIVPVFWRESDCEGFGEEMDVQFAIGHDVEGEEVNDSCCKKCKGF
jgi:type IV pilus biogenesis protein CpaD/CtpE